MNRFERYSKSLLWFMALLLVFIVAGCGGGGGDTGDGIKKFNEDSTPVPGAPGAIPPGEMPSGTTGTLGSTGPAVVSSNPTNLATNVAVGTVGSDNVIAPRTISATFTEAMNPTTIAASFTVKETVSGDPVAGNISVDATNTIATFKPDAVLASNTQFTAIISREAKNTVGTALISIYGWSFTTGEQIGQAPISLGTAAGFVVLGSTSIDNLSSAINPTKVNGNLGISPGSATNVTGFTDSTPAGTGIISTGGIQSGAAVSQAKDAFVAALSEANARTVNQISVGSSDLAAFAVSGSNLGVYPPGLYTSGSPLALNGNMTLDARGDPDAVWVFKAASSLTVGDASKILLVNGAKAKNVFWRMGSDAAIGNQVSFKGNILAATSIAIGTAAASGTTVEGRVMSVTRLELNYVTITIDAPAP